MRAKMLALQSRNFLKVFVSILFLICMAVSVSPSIAYATGIGLPHLFNPMTMSPFARTPFYPQTQYCGMTGQLAPFGPCGVNPIAVFNGLNWSGAQPMGSSYLTPMGFSTIMNSMNHDRITTAIGGAAY